MEIGKSFLLKNFCNSVWLMNPLCLNNMVNLLSLKFAQNPAIYAELVKEKRENSSPLVQRVNRTAILNIEGTLVPKCSWLDSVCGMVSTLDLINEFQGLELDNSVDDIILYMDTPGGVSMGIGELAEIIHSSNKNTIAYTDGQCCSAGYVIASAAKKLYSLPSATVGSIGACITMMKEKDSAIDYYIMGEGEQKLFGNPNVAVTPEELSFFKGMVHESYEWINLTVSRYRGVDVATVKATKSGYYDASSAPDWMVDDFMTSSGLNI